VFWCLFDDDIPKEMSAVGFKNGRGIRKDIVERGSERGGTGRVSGLVLSHHIRAVCASQWWARWGKPSRSRAEAAPSVQRF